MTLLLPAIPTLPLLAALLCVVLNPRSSAVRVASLLATLPAILLLPLAPPGIEWDAGALLSGMALQADETARLLSFASGPVWLGVVALRWRQVGSRSGWLCLNLTMAGNFTVLIAADIVTFYCAFALMSFAAYGLVVEAGTAAARRAGRLYIGFVVAGELLLFTGLVLATGSGAYRIDALAPVGNLAAVPLLLAFGIKCGLVPVHAALPITYSAASVPVSLALAGAMLNAGLAGWLRLLPMTGAEPIFWQAVAALGVLSLLIGAIAGLAQRDPRALLAYSTIGQAGFIAAALAATAATGTQSATAFSAYVAHHALVKGALVAMAGVALAQLRGKAAIVAWLTLAAAALGLAGMPLTAGYAVKSGLMTTGLDGWIGYLSSAVSAMLAMRLTLMLRRESEARAEVGLTLTVAAALAALALLVPVLSGTGAPWSFGIFSPTAVAVIVAAGGIVLLADKILTAASWPSVPPGDLFVVLDRALLNLPHGLLAELTGHAWTKTLGGLANRSLAGLDRMFADVEAALSNWGVIIALLSITALLLLAVGFG